MLQICYRERKLSAPPLASSPPDDVFVPSNALDITVLTCYLDQYFFYNMNTERGKDDVLYEDCVSKGEDIFKGDGSTDGIRFFKILKDGEWLNNKFCQIQNLVLFDSSCAMEA